MTQLLAYFVVLGLTLYLLSWWGRRRAFSGASPAVAKPSRAFRPKPHPREVWVQVYETASLEEGRQLQARLQEEEVDCILYEQGKKDIHGNPLKGIGIAVPKTEAPHAQRIISRMLG